MNPDQEPTDMSHDDDRLRALLHDAVSDVTPRDGLAEVRRRTRARRTDSRRWAPVLVGGGAVAATVVAATFVVRGLGDDASDRDSDPPAASQTEQPAGSTAGIYFLGETPTGPRLYREFQSLPEAADEEELVLLALERLTVDAGPDDPDYRTLWPSESFAAVQVDDDRVIVELGTETALQAPDGAGVSRLGVQQAVYTAEAAIGDTLPVAFEWDGRPAERVLGQRIGALVERDRQYDVTAPVNISDPAEGLEVEETLVARGTMGSYIEARNLRWRITRDGDILLEGRATAAAVEGPDATATLGAPGWETEIDVSGLAPDEYVFVAAVTDTGQTSDAPTEYSDTRTFTVR